MHHFKHEIYIFNVGPCSSQLCFSLPECIYLQPARSIYKQSQSCGWSTYPPDVPPPRNEALLRACYWLIALNKALLNPYVWCGYVRGIGWPAIRTGLQSFTFSTWIFHHYISIFSQLLGVKRQLPGILGDLEIGGKTLGLTFHEILVHAFLHVKTSFLNWLVVILDCGFFHWLISYLHVFSYIGWTIRVWPNDVETSRIGWITIMLSPFQKWYLHKSWKP